MPGPPPQPPAPPSPRAPTHSSYAAVRHTPPSLAPPSAPMQSSYAAVMHTPPSLAPPTPVVTPGGAINARVSSDPAALAFASLLQHLGALTVQGPPPSSVQQINGQGAPPLSPLQAIMQRMADGVVSESDFFTHFHRTQCGMYTLASNRVEHHEACSWTLGNQHSRKTLAAAICMALLPCCRVSAFFTSLPPPPTNRRASSIVPSVMAPSSKQDERGKRSESPSSAAKHRSKAASSAKNPARRCKRNRGNSNNPKRTLVPAEREYLNRFLPAYREKKAVRGSAKTWWEDHVIPAFLKKFPCEDHHDKDKFLDTLTTYARNHSKNMNGKVISVEGFFEKARRKSSVRELYAKSVPKELEQAISAEKAKHVARGEDVRHVNIRSDVLGVMFSALSDEEKAAWKAKAKEALPKNKNQEPDEDECLSNVDSLPKSLRAWLIAFQEKLPRGWNFFLMSSGPGRDGIDSISAAKHRSKAASSAKNPARRRKRNRGNSNNPKRTLVPAEREYLNRFLPAYREKKAVRGSAKTWWEDHVIPAFLKKFPCEDHHDKDKFLDTLTTGLLREGSEKIQRAGALCEIHA
ncbi:hypothetical protein BOTBODRAFT_44177 [Botryobasidium botryosum FD-172 SS1]|uniref:Uncharacterized protein n=1 Tax=Botryobasidium botryosum (strain FD-172 SS1) TaxID=930990 RepID=A0A067MI45_BOTB1|nr:hypothetical protein BOTBODRAFT_44177 [Botryobasidium botryosum FD-172 SS1]